MAITLPTTSPPATTGAVKPPEASSAGGLQSRAYFERVVGFEEAHRAIIARFGRYPHRNEILGRPSTPEELEFLTQPGSRF